MLAMETETTVCDPRSLGGGGGTASGDYTQPPCAIPAEARKHCQGELLALAFAPGGEREGEGYDVSVSHDPPHLIVTPPGKNSQLRGWD